MANVPGLTTKKTTSPRQVMLAGTVFLPGGKIVDSSLSADAGNTGAVRILREGMLMGKITASGLYAPSVLGVLTVAYDASAAGVSMTVAAATATEIVRRLGASGTFKLTGPDVASGTVRTATITYSAVNTTTGVITVTDIVEDVSPAASIAETTKGVTAVTLVSETVEVQTITVTGTPTGGTMQIGYGSQWTTELAFNANSGTVQTALRLLTGLGSVTCGGGALPAATTVTMTGVVAPAMLDLDLSNLTGGTPAGTVVATTPYVAAVAAVTAVTEIQTITMSALDGTFRASYNGLWTTELDHDVSTANLQVALRLLSGLGSVTVAGTAGTSYVVTLTGLTGDVALLGLDTSNLVAYVGDFIAGSFVQPVDGSQTPLGLLATPYTTGIRVIDDDADDTADMALDHLVIGGLVDSSQIVNWPTDASLIAYVKAWLRAAGIAWAFDDAF